MAVDICNPQSSWTYAHARRRGHYYSRNAAPAAAADLRGPGPQDAKTLVIALHCSGSSGRQWRRLAETLGGQYAVVAPDLFGSGSNGHWSGERSFKLADEAAPVIDIIDACQAPVHLVGHSYGGAVALRVALARPSAWPVCHCTSLWRFTC
jgi:pimeloyl-ACP methyl ester carboxylesterase